MRVILMGNSQALRPNKRLGVPIVGKLESALAKHISDRGTVLGCYILFPDNTISNKYASLFHIILVTFKGVEMYCLLTGEQRYPRYLPQSSSSIIASVLAQDHVSSSQIIVAESNGGFVLLEAYSLKITKRFGLSHSLPSLNATKNVINSMISPAPEMLYVGYLSGVVKVWHTAMSNPQCCFGKEYESPPVKCLRYTNKHRKLVVGYEGTYENQHGRFVKLDSALLRVYIPNATESESIDIEGFSGTCFSIDLVERHDLLIALSSEECGLFIWNLVTYELLLKLNLPRFDVHPEIITQAMVIEMPKSNYLIFGSSDGSVVISELELGSESILWKALKKISLNLDGNYAVEYLSYIEKIDTLVVGNTFATASLISNFFEDAFGLEHSGFHEIKIDDLE